MIKNGRWLQELLGVSIDSIWLDIVVSGINYDSRKIENRNIFVALPGTKTDGNCFTQAAIEKGAKFIISEKENLTNLSDCCWIRVGDVRETLAIISKAFYDFAVDNLILIGVTGTNGKTTTTYIIKSVLDSNGIKTGLIGTTGAVIGEEKVELSHTTPESLELHQLFFKMVEKKITYVVMEVSSHALQLKRVFGINFKFAIFTNLTHDHLDFHGDLEHYFQAKKILFDKLNSKAISVVNTDDRYGMEIIKHTQSKVYTYSLDHESAIQGTLIRSDINSMKLKINFANQCHLFSIPLSGKFNAYNVLGAVGVLVQLGFSLLDLEKGLSHLQQVPGRFEKIRSETGLTGIVDYSHTPDSLEKILKALLEIKKQDQKIITVFGCGGDRDKNKRPIMGRIAEEYSDVVIVTSDNPRTENKEDIIQDILLGCENNKTSVEADRKLAIAKAVELATENDIILVAGKGHETYQETNGVRIHFDDREELKKAFEKYGK